MDTVEDETIDYDQTHFKFVCTGRREESSESLVSVAFSPYPTTVSDLKTAIQDRFQIPKCLQSISVSSEPLTVLTNIQSLKSLYVHPGEHFVVTYLDKANIESFKYCKYFSNYIKELQNPERPLQNICNIEYEFFVSRFLTEEFRLKRLHPWRNHSTAEANRQYLMQEKIIDTLLTIYSLLMDWANKKKHLSQYDISEIRCFITDADYMLMGYCMYFLWYFAETREARLYVVQRGGFEVMVQAMGVFSTRALLDRYYPKKSGYGEDVIRYICSCVGCLCNYGEFSQCQFLLARSRPALYNLLTFGITSDKDEVELKLMTAYCLFRISLNVNTHKYLLEADILEKILLFFAHSETMLSLYSGVLMCYSLSAMLSRLFSFSLDLFPAHLLSTISFTQVQQETVREGLEKYARSTLCSRWVTLSHLVDVFFAPLFSTVEGNPLKASVPNKAYSYITDMCMEINLMCLAVELSRSCHKQLVIEQGLVECLVCLPWVIEDKWRSRVNGIVKSFRDGMDLQVPTLHTLAAVRLAKDGQFSIRDIFKF